MLENEFIAGILFIQQVGLAVAGAACLWGIFFFVNARNTKDEQRIKACDLVKEKLFFPFVLGTVVAILGFAVKIASHFSFVRGLHLSIFIRIAASTASFGSVFSLGWLLLCALFLIGFFVFFLSREMYKKISHIFYFISFILIFILISFPTGLERLDLDRLFFIRHGFPLIFTFGTVVVTDFIFFFVRGSLRLKRIIYPYLPALNKMIWIGLGINFIGQWAIAGNPSVTAQFLFTETLIAIVIINGILFTGPLMTTLISGVSEKRVKPMARKWEIISDISGVISFSCWSSLTYFAFFTNFGLSYETFMYLFVGKTVFVYIAYLILDNMTDIPVSFVNTN